MKKVDKRVLARRKSKNLVYDALFKFLEKRPVGVITVTDLINESGVARSTFYRHFSSVADVLDGYFRCLDERFEDMSEEIPVDFASREYLTHVFRLYESIGDRLLILHRTGLSSRFIQAIWDFHASQLGSMSASSPERYELSYYAGAIYCVAYEWIEEGKRETPEELADIFLSFQKNLQKGHDFCH